MYDDPDKQAAYRRIQDFSTEQLIWRVMYAVNAFQDSPLLPAIRQKLQRLCEQASARILNDSHTPEGKKLSQAIDQCGKAYMHYVDSLAQGNSRAEEDKQNWLKDRERVIELTARVAPGSADIWKSMLGHETELLEQVIEDIRMGRYKSMTEITSLLRCLAADISDYLAKGSLHEHLPELEAPVGTGG